MMGVNDYVSGKRSIHGTHKETVCVSRGEKMKVIKVIIFILTLVLIVAERFRKAHRSAGYVIGE